MSLLSNNTLYNLDNSRNMKWKYLCINIMYNMCDISEKMSVK